MTDVTPAVRRTQMSPRDRRRFLIIFFLFLFLLFAGGMVAYVFDFQHQKVCPNGKIPLAQQTDDLGQVSYLCPGGLTVTQGLVP